MNNAYVPCEQVTCAGEGWRGEKTTSAGIATIIHNPIKENVFIISLIPYVFVISTLILVKVFHLSLTPV